MSSKINVLKFSDFLHEVTIVYRLKIDSNIFFGENFVFKLLGRKGSEMEIYEKKKKSAHGNFLGFFCMKLQ